MSIEQDLAALDRDAKVAKAHIDAGSALERLRTNRDFKTLVVEGYLKDEAVRLVHAKSNPALQSAADQAAIVRDIDAIGSLAQFFNTIGQRAQIAGKQMRDIDEARAEIIAEGN